MFNSNIPQTTSLLGVDSGGGFSTTPKTPEILNSLIAMTNPLDNYSFTLQSSLQQQSTTNLNGNHQMISQDSNHSSCSGSPLDSPAGSNTTPSVQQTRSQLIKAGLKLTIQSKRKMSSGDSSSGNEQSSIGKHARKSIAGDSSEDETDSRGTPKTGLTPEDEDRRRRRRERNKIAATKCRMKKRERTNNLVNESEQLETQNNDLKSTVRNLETERRKLLDMLQSHSPMCIRPGGYRPSPSSCQSPARKYLNDIGMGDGQCDQQQQMQDPHHQQQQQQHQQRTITAIPPMTTIKYSRNNLRHHQQSHTNHNVDLQQHQLPNGYCKPSPTTHEIGYLSSPTQDIGGCLQTDITSQQQQQNHQQPQQLQHQHHHHSQMTNLKTDYIPNCENSNGGTTVDSTPDFVLKSEMVDAQSPYTTVQSADRFLFETNCDVYDIKHGSSNNINNNNSNTINNNSNINNNNNTMDFHQQIATTPTYDNLLIKNDFLTQDSELLAQLTADDTDSEFTDLDSGITAYSHMTNGGCLA